MKIAAYANLYANLTLPDCLNRLSGIGIEAVEIASGNYNGAPHCPAVTEALSRRIGCGCLRQAQRRHTDRPRCNPECSH